MTVEIHANKDPDTVRIFIIRHGQTDHNVTKVLQGHLDIDLNDHGKNQADTVAKYLSSIPFDFFVSSDLLRCQNTTKPILSYHPDVPLKLTENLRERNMGVVQGMLLKDAIAQYGEDFRNLGEKFPDLIHRVELEWDSLIKSSLHNNYNNVGICTHGGVITGFINYLYGVKRYDLYKYLDPESLKVPFNTSVSVIDVNKHTKQGVIQRFGLTSHLGGQFEVKDQLLR